MTVRLFSFFLLFICSSLHAYDFDAVSIKIPDGFEGPNEQSMGQGFISSAFAYPHQNGFSTLLQLSVWDPGQTFPSLTLDELKEGTKDYLLQFLGGVQRKRQSFEKSDVEFVEISDHPMAKINWRGQLKGQKLHGVMYCLIYESKVYTFHTQDLESSNGEYTQLAVNAFEKMILTR